MVLAILVLILSLLITGIIFTYGDFTKLKIMKINFVGECLLFFSLTLVFVINTNVLGSFTGNDFVVQETIKDIDLRLDRLQMDLAAGIDDKQFASGESAAEEIDMLEKQVEYSNNQIKTANSISGLVAFLGAILVFISKIGKIKLEAMGDN